MNSSFTWMRRSGENIYLLLKEKMTSEMSLPTPNNAAVKNTFYFFKIFHKK
jgi:hypothetical protein